MSLRSVPTKQAMGIGTSMGWIGCPATRAVASRSGWAMAEVPGSAGKETAVREQYAAGRGHVPSCGRDLGARPEASEPGLEHPVERRRRRPADAAEAAGLSAEADRLSADRDQKNLRKPMVKELEV